MNLRGGGAEIIENLYCLLESFVRDSRAYMGKIIYPVIAKEMTAHLDMQGFFTNDKCFILTLNRYNENILFYLIALFNSKIMFWYFQQIGATLGANGYEMRKIFIEKLPIPKITESNQHLVDKIIALVDAILAIKTNRRRRIGHTEMIGFCATKVAPPKIGQNKASEVSLLATHVQSDNQCRTTDTSNLESEVDFLVYMLYHLNDEEIKVIEEKR